MPGDQLSLTRTPNNSHLFNPASLALRSPEQMVPVREDLIPVFLEEQ
jgi:hypothetical protein